MKKRYPRWQEIRAKNRSPEQIAKIDREVEHELIEMNLREMPKTQPNYHDDLLNDIQRDLTVLKWMVGCNLVMTMAILLKLFA